MKKEELLKQINKSDGELTISSISTKEEGENLISLAKHLEHEGKIVLLEYCLDKKPLAVSLKTKLVED
ncbi:hypothetical protein [Mesobacillus harenae]|uniref:hypothetical protein n=1 Tax=Mesobacillus harenae TaxID=2213203 RepID=UPI00157FCB4B|nr:hypothetical protein [Mesobacillus harenae]